jgi:hypothetical protein
MCGDFAKCLLYVVGVVISPAGGSVKGEGVTVVPGAIVASMIEEAVAFGRASLSPCGMVCGAPGSAGLCGTPSPPLSEEVSVFMASDILRLIVLWRFFLLCTLW